MICRLHDPLDDSVREIEMEHPAMTIITDPVFTIEGRVRTSRFELIGRDETGFDYRLVLE